MTRLIDITPKPVSIVELLTKEPERWTTGAMFKRTPAFASGSGIASRIDAECGCLGGLLNFVHYPYHDPKSQTLQGGYDEKLDCLIKAIDPQSTLQNSAGHAIIPTWNDEPGRTVEDVIELCRRAGV